MTHAITRIEKAGETGFHWWCLCGVTGTGPDELAARILREHLEGR